jgi:hypothetical protein
MRTIIRRFPTVNFIELLSSCSLRLFILFSAFQQQFVFIYFISRWQKWRERLWWLEFEAMVTLAREQSADEPAKEAEWPDWAKIRPMCYCVPWVGFRKSQKQPKFNFGLFFSTVKAILSGYGLGYILVDFFSFGHPVEGKLSEWEDLPHSSRSQQKSSFQLSELERSHLNWYTPGANFMNPLWLFSSVMKRRAFRGTM